MSEHFKPRTREEMLAWFKAYRPGWNVKGWTKDKMGAVLKGILTRRKRIKGS